MIDAGADPNLADRAGYSPLHFAAQGQHAAVAKALLSAGAIVDAADRFGNAPLWVALFNVGDGDGEVITVLLGAGADPDKEDDSGKSPRWLAETVDNYDLKRFIRR